MRNLRIGAVVAALFSYTIVVFAAPRPADNDPDKTLQEITAWYDAQIKKAVEKQSMDVTAIVQKREDSSSLAGCVGLVMPSPPWR